MARCAAVNADESATDLPPLHPAGPRNINVEPNLFRLFRRAEAVCRVERSRPSGPESPNRARKQSSIRRRARQSPSGRSREARRPRTPRGRRAPPGPSRLPRLRSKFPSEQLRARVSRTPPPRGLRAAKRMAAQAKGSVPRSRFPAQSVYHTAAPRSPSKK